MLEYQEKSYQKFISSASKVNEVLDLSECFSVGIKPGYFLSSHFAVARFGDFIFSLKKLYSSCISRGLSAALKILGFLAALFQNDNVVNGKQRSKTIRIAKKMDNE